MRTLVGWIGLLAAASVPGAGCGEPSPCSDDRDCASSLYCARATGQCAGVGDCAPRPQVCDLVFDPVCGCDGWTYGNACAAAAAGVNVSSRGACKLTCALDQDCPAGQVCEASTGCALPTLCVPGCHRDDDCGQGRVCKRVQCLTCPCPGTCEAGSRCTSNAQCAAASAYCARGVGDCAGAGSCTVRPQACPENIDPVCGCDGVTYSNACVAAAAGVNVAASGRCKRLCTGDETCPPGEVCELDTGCVEPRICAPGCHLDAECGPGGACQVVDCLTCPCPGRC